MTYEVEAKHRAASWKRYTPTLPEAAKAPAPYVGKEGRAGNKDYAFCLPPEFAALSLLPEVREDSLELFAELGIPWHAGVAGGPSNHLLSSQVQCVNALGQMVADPSRLVRAFGDLVSIDEVLEIEPGRCLTFEYIGPTDFFGECPDGVRIRGAYCTSVDAAFLHRARDGVIELVLIEWKYTEKYGKRTPEPKDKTRFKRYGEALADPNGPVRDDLLAFELLLDEPFYQLMRQQLLAHALEGSGAHGAGRVRLLHVSHPDNVEYQGSIWRDEQRLHGDTVSEIWKKLLRRPERFTSVDSTLFLDPNITSEEYAIRYGAPLIHDQAELMTAYQAAGPEDLLDLIPFEGDVVLVSEGVELMAGRVGTVVEYPFTLVELNAVIDEVEGSEEWDL